MTVIKQGLKVASALEKLALALNLHDSKVKRMVHFPEAALEHALDQVNNHNSFQDPFVICQEYCSKNQIPVDWELYKAIQKRYGDDSTPLIDRPTRTSKATAWPDHSQRMRDQLIHVILLGTQKLQDDPGYIVQWLFAAKDIPDDHLENVKNYHPIYRQIMI